MADKSKETTLQEMLQELDLIERRIAILHQQIRLLLSKEVEKDGKTKKGL